MNAETRRKLRELAEAATPGPWTVCAEYFVFNAHAQIAEAFGFGAPAEANAAFIAALHPGVVIEMLDAIERAEEDVAALSWSDGLD